MGLRVLLLLGVIVGESESDIGSVNDYSGRSIPPADRYELGAREARYSETLLTGKSLD